MLLYLIILLHKMYFEKKVIQNFIYVLGLSGMGEGSQKVDNSSDKVNNNRFLSQCIVTDKDIYY